MVSWQVTATTIYCEAVDGEVTLIVNKDGSTRCTDYRRYHEPDKDTARLMRSKGKRLNRKLECEGPDCYRVIQYKDKIFAEEAGDSGRGIDGGR